MPPRSRLGFREEAQEYAKRSRSQILFCLPHDEELEIYDNAFKNYFYLKAFDDYVFILLKLIACRICLFLSGLF